MGKITRLPVRPRQPDRRRRGGRAARLGRQGADRERARCGRPAPRGDDRTRRQEADPRRGRWRGDGPGRRAAVRSSGTRRARSAGPTTWRPSPRSGSAARRCPASRRCRTSCCARRRARSRRAAPRFASTAAWWRRASKSAMPEGTVVEVGDLFYNLPARRKFLKSDAAESAQVSRLVTQLALALSGGRVHARPAPGARCVQCPPVAGAAATVSTSSTASGRPDRGRNGAAGLRLHGFIAALRRAGADARRRRTSSSTAASSRTGRSRTPSSTPTAWRRSRSAARRCTCSSRCRRTGWT